MTQHHKQWILPEACRTCLAENLCEREVWNEMFSVPFSVTPFTSTQHYRSMQLALLWCLRSEYCRR
jgi:hypothetical protein